MHDLSLAPLAVACTCGVLLAGSAEPEGPRLVHVPGSTKKVCQLTGDLDRQTNQPTLSLTATRAGVVGTDLGSSFEHKGRLYFLFGDTHGGPPAGDAVAWTASTDPEQIELSFLLTTVQPVNARQPTGAGISGEDATTVRSSTVQSAEKGPEGRYLPIQVPGVRLGAFEVPSYGVSIDGHVYVVVTTDHSREKTMGRSVLAVSRDDARTFEKVYDLSCDKFINVAFWKLGRWLYVFGSGEYRQSSVSLARVRQADVLRKDSLQYFTGPSGEGSPNWSAVEKDAAALFRHDVVGELSVAYCEPVDRFVMLYNSRQPNGIVMRSSQHPWGPWSDATVIFNPWKDQGYGHFIHAPLAKADSHLSDRGRLLTFGGSYGPYLIARYTAGDAGACRVYFTMSTWNPYQVVVMRSELRLTND